MVVCGKECVWCGVMYGVECCVVLIGQYVDCVDYYVDVVQLCELCLWIDVLCEVDCDVVRVGGVMYVVQYVMFVGFELCVQSLIDEVVCVVDEYGYVWCVGVFWLIG